MNTFVESMTKSRYRNSANTNMFVFLLGKLVSLFGTRIMNFAIGLYVLRTTGSGMGFALTMIVGTIPAIIISPFAGVVADRVNRRVVVVLTDLLCGTVLVGMYLVALGRGFSMNLILVQVFLLSILNTFFNTTMEASVPNIVDPSRLTKINSYSSSINSLSAIVGPAIGGLVYGMFQIELFILVAGLCFILSAVSELFINFNFNQTPVAKRSKENIISDMKSALHYVRGKRIVLTILLFAVFINFVFSTYIVSLPYIINIELGLSSDQYGFIQSASALGSLVFSLLYALIPENKGKFKYLMAALVAMSALMILTGVPTLGTFGTPSPMTLLVYFTANNFALGGALMFLNLPSFILLQKETADEYRGRVNGFLWTMSLSIQPLGMALGGFFVDHISSFLLVLGCGTLLLTISLLMAKDQQLREAF
ncbi:MAG: MFS transporter [Firmicutes bacterium]|nr:MFS transporter [Bacillota bacterium]